MHNYDCMQFHCNFDYYRPDISTNDFQSYVKELEKIVTLENTLVHYFLPHNNSQLHIVVLTSTAAMSSETSCTEQIKSEKNSSKQKVWHIRGGGFQITSKA